MKPIVRRRHRPSSIPTTTRAIGRAESRRRSAVAAAVMVGSAIAGVVSVVAADPGTASAGRTWFVEVDGSDRASGAADAPLATIEQAVRVAGDGDTIRIGPGTYHESVQVYRESLTLVGSGEGRTVLDGARPVTGFAREFDGRWGAAWSTSFQRSQPPHTTAERPEAGWPEQFFLDGAPLTEVSRRADVRPGTFFLEVSSGRVILGDDPRSRLVEGSDLSWGLYLNHASGSSVSDLTIRRYATEERHMAAFRAYANDLDVRRVTVVDNARIGLSVMGDRVDVDDVEARRNGYLGMHAHRADDLSITNSVIHDNNSERFDAWHAAGGFKSTEGHRLELRGNDVRRNHGPGLWTDLDVRHVVVADNVVLDNYRSGVEIELSSDVIVVDNIVGGNGEQGVWVLESSRVDVWHNHLSGNERAVWVLDGPRADLVDVRVGNNAFVGPASAGVLVGVDDWTEQRNASDMGVVLDGNRYRTVGEHGLVRWSNWPASLTIVGDLDTLRRTTGQELSGLQERASIASFGEIPAALIPTPPHVAAVRSGATVEPYEPTTTPTGGSTTPVGGTAGDPATPTPDARGSERGGRAGTAVVVGNPTATRRTGATVTSGDASGSFDAEPAPGVVTSPDRPTEEPPSADGTSAGGTAALEPATVASIGEDPVPEVASERGGAPTGGGWQAFGDQLRLVLQVSS